MNGKIGTIGRILAVCVLGVFLAQGAMAAPAQRAGKAADRALRTELKVLHQQEKMAKSPEERSAIRAQMKAKRHQALVAKKAQRSARRGVK
jgi:cell division protein FtsB